MEWIADSNRALFHPVSWWHFRGWLSREPPRSVHLGNKRTVEIVMEITMITACVWIPIGNHENHDYCYRLENSKCASQSSCLIQRHVRSCEYLSCRFLQTETSKTMAPSQKICGDTVQPKIAISAAQMLHARPSESCTATSEEHKSPLQEMLLTFGNWDEYI